MAKYTSKTITVPVNINELYSKFDDLSEMQKLLDQLPPDAREKVGDVEFHKNSIIIKTPQVGEIKFVVKERIAPSKVVFTTESSPLPLTLTANFTSSGDTSTEITTETEVDVPAIMKPLVGPAMQKATDQFGQLMGQLGSLKQS